MNEAIARRRAHSKAVQRVESNASSLGAGFKSARAPHAVQSASDVQPAVGLQRFDPAFQVPPYRFEHDLAALAVDTPHLADMAREMTFSDERGERVLRQDGAMPVRVLLRGDESTSRPD